MLELNIKKPKKRRKNGFTLIEIMAVMAIIAGLAVAIIPSIKTAINRSNDTKLRTNLTLIDGAGKVYRLDKGSYPQDLTVLMSENYIPKKEYKDANGKDIQYDKTGGFAFGTNSVGKIVKSNQED